MQPTDRERADDHATIEGMVHAFLSAFATGPDVVERLDALRGMFIPEATIIAFGGPDPTVYDVDTFIAPRQRLLTEGTLLDFREWEETGRTQLFGNIAQRWSTYAKTGVQNGEAFTGRGQKTIQFVRTTAGWRISSVAWDDER